MTTAEDTVEPITDEALGEVCAEAAMIAPLARTMHTEPGSGAIYWDGEGGEPLGGFTDWGLARAVAVIVRSFRPVVARLNEARTQRDAALSDLAQARADLAERGREVERVRAALAEVVAADDEWERRAREGLNSFAEDGKRVILLPLRKTVAMQNARAALTGDEA